jgi:hypothetical protein
MIAHILDQRDEGSSVCFLARLSLEDYIAALPETYKAYDVQREIVSNVYLDHLVNTVLDKRHIPPIVLVVDAGGFSKDASELKIESFKILDGLQRTYRLRSIRETIRYALNAEQSKLNEFLSWSKFKFSRHFSEDLRGIESNTDVLRSIFEAISKHGPDNVLETYTQNNQWFEIWTGLTPEEEVRKMLTLNAGHKPVKTRHQLELLFMNLLPVLRADVGSTFQLVREKEVGATQFSKDRTCGSFHFAHIITALLSLYSGKPIAPTTDLIQGIQNDGNVDEYSEFMQPEFLRLFVDVIVKLDQVISEAYGDVGTRWMGREVSLAGLFAGVGAVALERNIPREQVLDSLQEIITRTPKMLNLEEFEAERNSVELSKVNIGNINRNAVLRATETILKDNGNTPINWRDFFKASVQ